MDAVSRLLVENDRSIWENNRLVSVEVSREPAAVGVLICSDLLAIIASVAALRILLGPTTDIGAALLVVGGVIYALGLSLVGLYPGRGMLGPMRIRLRALVSLMAWAPLSIVGFILQSVQFELYLAEYLGIGALLFLLGSFFEIVAIHTADALGFWRSSAVFVGDPNVGAQVKSDLRIFPELGLKIVDGSNEAPVATLTQIQTFPRLNRNATDIFVVDSASPLPVYHPASGKLDGAHGAGTEVIARAMKRTIDIVGSIVALILFSPVLLLAAICIYLTDGGPIFFTQERGGQGGKMFNAWKLRSMYRDAQERLDTVLDADPALRAEWDQYFKLRHDPRILPGIGEFIRTSSIDEVPQFWNVLKGEMSMVGPRPFPENHLAAFSEEFCAMRAQCIPGISGLWQVTLRSNGDLEAQERLDRAYIEGWSFWLDLYILFRTPIALVTSSGAV